MRDGMEFTAEVEAEEREKERIRRQELDRQLALYSEVPADPSEVEGEIVLSEEILEAQDAMAAFDELSAAIKVSTKQQAALHPMTKEQLMIKRAKAKKAKRKRGGPR